MNAIVQTLLLMVLLLLAPGAQAQGRDFDHLRTGFPLTGTHVNARCESCHVGGQFKGTPKDCESCHISGARLARGNVVKTPEHINTPLQTCDSCHTTRTFTGARMNHATVVRGTCASCHNGVQSSGKPATHLRTTASCDSCHSNQAWRPATGFDHAGVAPGTCGTCHNGIQATGKSAGHTPYQLVATTSSANCDTCHKAGSKSWTPASVHSNTTITAQCASCHASTKPNTAVHAGQTNCETCHKSNSTWSGAKVDHSTYTAATNCSSCHNGSAASGKNSTHIPVGATNCIACHTTSKWTPSTYNHSQTVAAGQCGSCHTGTFPPADGRGATHTPYWLITGASAANCDACHKGSTTTWTNGKLHANVTVASQCNTCHASVKPNTTVHVGQTACETCHKSFTTWTGAKVDHSMFTVATNCSSCHNGSGATGKNSTHIPVGVTNCIACHTTTKWTPSSFNHTQTVATAQCASCHTGTFPPADGRGAGHLPYQLIAGAAAANCDACHKNSFTTWANGKFHANFTVTGQCKTCHSGSYTSQAAVGKTANHIPEAQLLNGAAMECNACHTSTASWGTVRMEHNNSLGGGAGWCKGCHLRGTSYAGSLERMALTHKTKTPPAIDCSESGCHRPLGTKGSTYKNWD